MLKILPDVKVYYNGQLVLPSKEIEIFTSDYKDPWIYKVLKKISGEPYAIDFSNQIKTNVIDRLLKSKLKDNILWFDPKKNAPNMRGLKWILYICRN